jgi:very-short-patch-repair endonuclease
MPGDWRNGPAGPGRSAKVRVAAVAEKQRGRITWAQLRTLGIPRSTITEWVGAAFLFPKLPGVYAVGHAGTSPEADLFAAVLYAGPDAGLGGMSAGLWRGVVKWRTAKAIEVWTPRRKSSLPARDPANHVGKPVVVRSRRTFKRDFWNGIPTVPIPQIVLELARTEGLELVRFVLSNLDYLRLLDESALRKLTGPGVPGSAVLKAALGRPQPLLARTRSWFEVRLIFVCELTGMRLPDDTNVVIAGYRVDAVWWDEMVVVACDGEGNHGTFRQRRRDLGEDMALRGLGFLPIRYTTDKLDDPWAVDADLGSELRERRGRRGLRAAG